MNRYAMMAGAALAALTPRLADAHAIAGDRVFPATLVVDDPSVADEASFPTYTWNPADKGQPTVRLSTIGFEYDKRITEDFGFAVNGNYNVIPQPGDKTLMGWDDWQLTLKWKALVIPEHEFITSLGVVQTFGGSGSQSVGASPNGSTQPTWYFGKGMGDLPASWGLVRPFAVTGEFSYSISNGGKYNTYAPDPVVGYDTTTTHTPNFWNFGGSIQYSLPYLQAQVKDYGLPDWVNSLVPLVEMSFSTPATKGYGIGPQGIIAPGVIYLGSYWQFGVEALIPANKASGSNVGVIAQFHMYLDDLFPHSLGKPIFGGD